MRWIIFLAVCWPAWSLAQGNDAAATVLVVGASGKTGGEILSAAEASGYRVRPTTRNVQRPSRDGRDDWFELDVRDAERVSLAVDGVDYVICAIGTREFTGDSGPAYVDYLGVANLVDAAAAAKVKHFVLISSAAAGVHRDHTGTAMMGFIRYWKTMGEQHLKASGVNYTIIGPGGLTDAPARRSGLKAFHRRGYGRAATSRADVARVAVAALEMRRARNKSLALVNNSAVPAEAWVDMLDAVPTDGEVEGFHQLEWMAGHWRSPDMKEEEFWLPPAGQLMVGVNRQIGAPNSKAQFEYLRIERVGRGLVYFAQPGGRTAAAFKLTDVSAERAVFSRSVDDFPTTLVYARSGDDLRVMALGRREDRPLALRWEWSLAPTSPDDR